MVNNTYSIDFRLLSLCAILKSFNYDTLNAFSELTISDLEELLISDIVIRLQDEIDVYTLREDVREDVLARLRNEQPLEEQALHARAFQYFLHHIAQNETNADIFEQRCFYHLDELFLILARRREWNTIIQYISIAQEINAHQPKNVYNILFYKGHVSLKTQDYEQAEHIFSFLLNKADLPSNIRVRVLNGIALVNMDQSRYDYALDYYHIVYRISCEIEDLFYQGVSLINMGMIYNELEYYDLSLDFTTRSLDVFRNTGDKYLEALALYELGNSSLRLGRWKAAKQYFAQSTDLYIFLDLKSPLGTVYLGLGLLNHVLGNEIESETVYLQSLDILLAPEYNNSKIGGEVLWQLAFLYHTQSRWDEALDCYDKALALATELCRPHYISLIHYQRGNLFKRLGRLEETREAYRQAIETIETLRGATEGEEIKIGLLGTTQQIYEAMVLLCLEQGQLDEAFAYVERARSRAFLDTLAKKDPELYAALDEPVVTLEDVQRQLPQGGLLVEYFTTGVLPRGEHMLNNLPKENVRLREHLTLPPRIIMFAITRDHFEVHHLDQATLDPNKLRPKENDPDPIQGLLGERMLLLLYQRLIGPVEHLLQKSSLLYLIPHGPLHYVPFMALRSASGSYLLDRSGPAMALAPSATVLFRNCLGRPKGRGNRFVALGYDDAERGLCYAEAEAREIARLMDGEAWTGPEPKSEALFEAGPELRWLHIASHAAYNPRAPLDSELFLSAEDRLSARTIMSKLHLRADGVTLSACTSGLGHVVAGDELLGMQRAWLYAGAPTVVCTLWETADLVALLVMEHFYSGLQEGRPAAAALRDAQVAVRELTVADLGAIIERWRAHDTISPSALDSLAERLTLDAQTRPFAAPQNWAPFMLIGQPE